MLEAMAAGCPVIACRDAVPRPLEEAARTFPARDSGALRLELETLLADEGLRARAINSGREVARRLTGTVARALPPTSTARFWSNDEMDSRDFVVGCNACIGAAADRDRDQRRRVVASAAPAVRARRPLRPGTPNPGRARTLVRPLRESRHDTGRIENGRARAGQPRRPGRRGPAAARSATNGGRERALRAAALLHRRSRSASALRPQGQRGDHRRAVRGPIGQRFDLDIQRLRAVRHRRGSRRALRSADAYAGLRRQRQDDPDRRQCDRRSRRRQRQRHIAG